MLSSVFNGNRIGELVSTAFDLFVIRLEQFIQNLLRGVFALVEFLFRFAIGAKCRNQRVRPCLGLAQLSFGFIDIGLGLFYCLESPGIDIVGLLGDGPGHKLIGGGAGATVLGDRLELSFYRTQLLLIH